MGLQCPECASDNVQRVSIVFESGTSTIQSRTAGVGLVGGGLGVGGATTKGVQQTTLSQKLAPPSKHRMKTAIGLIIVGLIILSAPSVGAKIFGLLFIGGGGIAGYLTFRFNKNDYPVLLNKWRSSFYCNVCGSVFEPQAMLDSNSTPLPG